jgi:hypothetical protein
MLVARQGRGVHSLTSVKIALVLEHDGKFFIIARLSVGKEFKNV